MNYSFVDRDKKDIFAYMVEKSDYDKFLKAVKKIKNKAVKDVVEPIMVLNDISEVFIIEDGTYTYYYGSRQKFNMMEKVCIPKYKYFCVELGDDSEFDYDIVSAIDLIKADIENDIEFEDIDIDFSYCIYEKVDEIDKLFFKVKI